MNTEAKVIVDTSFDIQGFPSLRLDVGRTVHPVSLRVLLVGAWAIGPHGQVRMWHKGFHGWEAFTPQRPAEWPELDSVVLPFLNAANY